MSDTGEKEPASSKKVEKTLHQIESRKNFSESSLWQFQQKYYEEAGVKAWSSGTVPLYITSNPRIANSYAEMVWAFFQDQQQLLAGDDLKERLYVFELGTGSGRFSYYFITRLAQLCQEAGFDPAQTFCYVMTDLVPANLEFVGQHPSLQPFFESGLLDTALFDVTRPGAFTLKNSGLEIAPASLVRPPVVIGNYLFDTIPVDIFYFYHGQVLRGLLSLSVEQEYANRDVQEQFAHMHHQYNFVRLNEAAYAEPDFEELVNFYRDNLKDTYLLFPIVGLRCLKWFGSLSNNGFLLLTSDKGEFRLEGLEGRAVPKIVQHGSFSLDVNFHALKLFCEQKGGLSLCPTFPDALNTVALIFTADPARYRNTRSAYRRFSLEFNATDFYRLTQIAEQHFAKFSLREMFAYLRFSYFDSELFGHFLPHLLEILPTVRAEERQEIKALVDQMWSMYFPIAEDYNLAEYCAGLLYTLGDFRGAITYFNHAIAIYGPRANFLFNLAVCHYQLDETEPAIALLKTVLEQDGSNKDAARLLAELQAPA